MKLSDMKVGDKGVIESLSASGEIRRRLLDMGLVPGVKFKILRTAPLGDPIQLHMRGFHLSLRKEEANGVEVTVIGHRGDGQPMADTPYRYTPKPQPKPHTNPHPTSGNKAPEEAQGPGPEPAGPAGPAGPAEPAGNGTEEERSAGTPPRKGAGPRKEITVALMGNPNSGKTSLFNALAGANQKVGNFTGVTVESYEGVRKQGDYTLRFIDLPGIYSMTAYSPEEVVSRNYLIEQQPDLVIDVVDGTNLERNLYLTTQLMEMETNTLVALNMADEMEKQQIEVDTAQLERLLGSHVIPTSAKDGKGVQALLEHIVQVYEGKIAIAKNKLTYSPVMEETIDRVAESLGRDPELTACCPARWLAVKLLENDQLVYETVKERSVWIRTEMAVKEAHRTVQAQDRRDAEMAITEDRHAFIRGALHETVRQPEEPAESVTDKIDKVLLNRFLGIPIFLGIMWALFQVTFALGQYPAGWMEQLFAWTASGLTRVLPAGLVRDVLVDGILAGVGGVLVFLPNILLLFFGIALMEASGYMARAAFVIDKVMHHFGLHGKSFIPMITGFGCSVPAFMACRTLKNRSDRITTMLIIPFMSCGAKLPVYILLISAFFPPAMAGNVLFGVYMFGVILALVMARILKKGLFKNESEPFVMELPPYRRPSLKGLFQQMYFKAAMYLKKAGTIILAASVIIWIATTYPESPSVAEEYGERIQEATTAEEAEGLALEQQAAQLERTFAGRIGHLIEPVIRPLGFDWKIGIALTGGLAAKEIVVSTLATIYAVEEDAAEDGTFAERLKADPEFDRATALSLLVFVLLYIPCLAATVVFHREAGSWHWTRFYMAYTMVTAWVMSFLVYRAALLIG